MGNPTFRSQTTDEDLGVTPAVILMNMPSGAVEGDLLIFLCSVDADLTTFTPNAVNETGGAPFTNRFEGVDSASGKVWGSVSTMIHRASESSSFTFHHHSNTWRAILIAVQGAPDEFDLEVHDFSFDGEDVVIPSATPTDADSMSFLARMDERSYVGVTTPTGYTLRFNASDDAFVVFTESGIPASATGTQNVGECDKEAIGVQVIVGPGASGITITAVPTTSAWATQGASLFNIPGQQWAIFTGLSNDHDIRAADAALGITGDCDVHALVKWQAASGEQEIASNWRFGVDEAWSFKINNGKLTLWLSGPGGGDSFLGSNVDLDTVIAVGDWIHVRAWFEASTSQIKFRTKKLTADAWVQIGATATPPQTGLAATAPDVMDVNRGIQGDLDSSIAWVELYSDEGSTLVGKCDFADADRIDQSWVGAVDGLTWTPTTPSGWILTESQLITVVPATSTWATQPATLTEGALTFTAVPSSSSWATQAVILTEGPHTVTAVPSSSTWSSEPVTFAFEAITVTATPASTVWTSEPITWAFEATLITAAPSASAWSAEPVTLTEGSHTFNAAPSTSTWSVPVVVWSSATIIIVVPSTSVWTTQAATLTEESHTFNAAPSISAWSVSVVVWSFEVTTIIVVPSTSAWATQAVVFTEGSHTFSATPSTSAWSVSVAVFSFEATTITTVPTSSAWSVPVIVFAFEATTITAVPSSSTWATQAATITTPTTTLEQEGMQWYNDDGSESAATTAAGQDTAITFAIGVTKRARFLINASGDPNSQQYLLQYKKSDESVWIDGAPE